MSYFGSKHVILGHLGPKKVDVGHFFYPFSATFELFRDIFAKPSCTGLPGNGIQSTKTLF